MRLSPIFLLLFPLPLLTHASPFEDLLPRQQEQPKLNGSTLTSGPAFSSAAVQIAAQNIPSSLIPGFAIAIQSAAQSASVTGDINSLVSSILTATIAPDFLTAVPLPPQYSSRLAAIENQLSVIKSQASEATVRPTTTGNVTQLTTITSSGSRVITTSLAATVNGTMTSAFGYMNGSLTSTMASSTMSGGRAGEMTGGGASPTSSSSGGLAAATKVPLAFAAAGMMGLVGVAAVL
ncbi:MAG: hypothetical protein LQ350_005460 [Teloschistes chrysophthalmus]|nr:MAG: hypothetical protein LQ350_005460 [Niorma chrysophthalma]